MQQQICAKKSVIRTKTNVIDTHCDVENTEANDMGVFSDQRTLSHTFLTWQGVLFSCYSYTKFDYV